VNLLELREHIGGMAPPTVVTLDERGVPNVIHISHAMVIDKELLALSRQFFKKTLANLERDPRATLCVTNQRTFETHCLYRSRVRVETSGPAFEAMSARVDAIAAASGMTDIFAVKAIDVFRVLRIEQMTGLAG
jgi:adenylate cyclase